MSTRSNTYIVAELPKTRKQQMFNFTGNTLNYPNMLIYFKKAIYVYIYTERINWNFCLLIVIKVFNTYNKKIINCRLRGILLLTICAVLTDTRFLY